ncbi:MAG: aminoacyl-tRNA deacylase, partial [Lactococcus garvieae]
MSKKKKLKKTLVEQILDKGQVNHEGLALNALEEELMPEDIQRRDIYKTLALIGDKTGPIVGILPLTEHLS